MTLADLLVNFIQSMTIGFACVRYAQSKKWIHAFLLGTLIFAEITYFNSSFQYEGFLVLVYSLTIFLYMKLFADCDWIESLFLASFINLLFSFGNDFWLWLIGTLTHISINEIARSVLLRSCLGIGSSIILLLIMSFLTYIRKHFENIFTRYTKIILLISIISNVVVILLEDILYLSVHVEEELQILLSILCVLLISILSVVLLFTEKAESIKSQNITLLAQQFDSMKDRLNDYEKQNERYSILRHDLKNHFFILDQYLEEGNLLKAKELVEKYAEEVNSIQTYALTGIVSIDSILTSKNTKANERGIDFKVNINTSQLGKFDEFDLSILLANGLDNAIEHSSHNNASITLSISELNEQLRLVIRNTVDTQVLKQNPNLRTTKQDIQHHGYGIESMKLITKKYDGHLSFSQMDDEFVMLAILPITHS